MTLRKLPLNLVALFLVLVLWIAMLGFVPYYMDEMQERKTVGLGSIHGAIRAGNLAAVTYWLEKGVDANGSWGYTLKVALNSFAGLQSPSPPSPEIVSLLIENGVDVNGIDSGGKTPLMDALDNRWTGYPHNPEIVSLLLDAGAEVNACNNNGWTPLMCALSDRRPGSHSLEIVSLLLETGAEVNASNNNGSTPLMYASRSCCPKPEIIMLLLDEGADPLAINKLGLKAFFYLRLNDELQDTEAYKKLQASSFK